MFCQKGPSLICLFHFTNEEVCIYFNFISLSLSLSLCVCVCVSLITMYFRHHCVFLTESLYLSLSLRLSLSLFSLSFSLHGVSNNRRFRPYFCPIKQNNFYIESFLIVYYAVGYFNLNFVRFFQ